MKLTDFDALSFDCYGTLIDWEAGLSAVLVPWARERGLTLTGEQLLTEYAAIEAAVEAEHPARLYPDVLAESMQVLGIKLNARVTSEDAARLAGSVPDWPAFPDSRDALLALSERFRLIILSNVDRASFAGSSSWLGATFASVITAQDVGSYKPAQANFDALTAAARGSASGPAGSCTWRRACSTTTCQPSRRGFPPYGSTGGTTGGAGAPPPSRPPR
jgi:2-haloacid dehalogenase